MPITKSAIKEKRKNKRRRERNKAVLHKLKLAIKTFKKAKTYEEALPLMKSAISLLDKAKSKKNIHWKNANRKKSRLALFLKKLASKKQ